MAYSKTTWRDRQVQYPSRFIRTSDGTYDTLAPAPGTITNSGTPITSTVLNNLETQYDEAVAWAKSFGLGDVAKDVSNTDINNLDTTGFYKGQNLTNAPESGSGVYWYIIHLKHASTYMSQIAIKLNVSGTTPLGFVLTRTMATGTWGPWRQIVTLTDKGILNLPNQSAVIINSVGVQNIASDVVNKLSALTSDMVDRQSEWANSTFTAKESGIYYVRAFLDWGSTVPSNSSAIYLYKNGTNYNVAITIAGVARYVDGSCLVQLNAGDTLELYALQSSGGTQKTLAASRIEIAKLM